MSDSYTKNMEGKYINLYIKMYLLGVSITLYGLYTGIVWFYGLNNRNRKTGRAYADIVNMLGSSMLAKSFYIKTKPMIHYFIMWIH